MDLVFKELENDQKVFFEMLPTDWQSEIVPFWEDYQNSSKIYVLFENKTLIGGGIVFSKTPPDVLYYETEAKEWFENGFLYLGFIWIIEEKRGKNLGSIWLDELKKSFPNQNYWLLIEEEHLHRFYQKNGFKLDTALAHEAHCEWLYYYRAP